MTLFIGVVSQKGGVGKSSLCQLIACSYAGAEWTTLIADMDTSQATSFKWNEDRQQGGIEPTITVEKFSRVDAVIRKSDAYDLVIFDGPPHATTGTKQIAERSQLVILPTGLSIRDLEPTIRLAHSLKADGISQDNIAITLCRVGDSKGENQEAVDYIKQSKYFLLDAAISERTGYRRAIDAGYAMNETLYRSLNEKAGRVISVIDKRLRRLEREAA